MKYLERIAIVFLCLAMVFAFTPVLPFTDGTVAAAEASFIDMPSDWSTAALEHAVANGLLKGYDVNGGTEIRAGGNITRAEMATVVNRAFGATAEESLSGVADVPSGKWYASEIAKAIGMQTMTKAANMRPDDKVTRQEAFTILARAYKQVGGSNADLAKFADAASVASWAVDGLGALVKNGYVSGSGNTLNPTGYMTRAEFAKIMDNLTAAYVNTTEKYSKDVNGNVIVNVAGAKLENMKISGDLIVAEGVGEGDVDINDVQIGGDIIVKAGGENSIHIANVTVGGTLVVNKVGGTVRIVASGTTNVKMVEVGSDVIITATDLKGGEIGTVKIEGSDVSDVVLRGDFKTVETAVKDVKITANEGKIGEFVMTEKATVTGASTIATVKNETNEAVSVNGKTVEAGKSTSSGTTDTPAATGGSTGGGGGASGGGGTGGGSGSGGGSGTGGGGTTQPTTKYTITVSDTTNGTVTAAKTSNIEAGESVVITITPNANYQLQTITVNGVNKTSSVADGKLTVTVNENLTVAATFESTSTGGGGGQASENPAPDNFVLGGANTFAEGYPQFNLAENKLTIKMAMDTPSEIFGIHNNWNASYDADSISVIHGHPSEFMEVADVICLNVSDTEEHEIELEASAHTNGGYVALVVKTGDKISAEPVKLPYSPQAAQEADTTKPFAWTAFINSAGNKIYMTVDEQVTIDQAQVATDFHLSNGTITSAEVVSDEADNGFKKYFVVLNIEGYDSGQECKLWYGGVSVKDTAENPLTARIEDNAITVETSAVTINEATSSQDMKHIEIETSKSFLYSEIYSNTHERNDWYTIKYGTDWESAEEVTASDVSWLYSNSGRLGHFYFEINNPPTAISGGKYFVEIECNGWKNICFDACAGNLKTEVTRLAKAESPTPTVKYNASSKRITINFGSHEIKGDAYNSYAGPACRFFITAQNGVKYKLRDNTSACTLEGNCITYGEKAFPFNPATFNWEGATLSYSRAIHADECDYFEELHTADGNIYESFSNITIIVE